MSNDRFEFLNTLKITTRCLKYNGNFIYYMIALVYGIQHYKNSLNCKLCIRGRN